MAKISKSLFLSTLPVSFAVSVFIHAVVMSVTFVMPAAMALRTPSLDVILVNARHLEAPTDPQALAQANLDGGGNNEEDVRAASPLPPQETTSEGNDIVDMTRGQQMPAQQQQQEILTRTGSPVAVVTENAQDKAAKSQPANSNDDMDARAMALKLDGEIAAKTQAYNQRPRRMQVGARAMEWRFAQYVESWRMKAERIGDLNYPSAARGKMYDSLLMTVSIKKDGTIEKIAINRPSKYKLLNEAAERIVRMGEPYAPFPPDIARDTDVLDISRTWTFTNNRLITK
ncbi:MAG: energy transducer TonB [Azoarcus sp.]|jgi:protein TonB|nr:energy transducer TonB [Azoarcus sp.]